LKRCSFINLETSVVALAPFYTAAVNRTRPKLLLYLLRLHHAQAYEGEGIHLRGGGLVRKPHPGSGPRKGNNHHCHSGKARIRHLLLVRMPRPSTGQGWKRKCWKKSAPYTLSQPTSTPPKPDAPPGRCFPRRRLSVTMGWRFRSGKNLWGCFCGVDNINVL
jgi:hypothetical protein